MEHYLQRAPTPQEGFCSLGAGNLGAKRVPQSSLVFLALATSFCTALNLEEIKFHVCISSSPLTLWKEVE